MDHPLRILYYQGTFNLPDSLIIKIDHFLQVAKGNRSIFIVRLFPQLQISELEIARL